MKTVWMIHYKIYGCRGRFCVIPYSKHTLQEAWDWFANDFGTNGSYSDFQAIEIAVDDPLLDRPRRKF